MVRVDQAARGVERGPASVGRCVTGSTCLKASRLARTVYKNMSIFGELAVQTGASDRATTDKED
jgi:hypothetical protein